MASNNTEERRERVRSLWLKSDLQIAEALLDEGYGGAIKRSADAKATQLASMRRNVWNDRKALKAKWRTMKRMESADVHESRGEHLAVLDSLQDMGVEMLSDPKLKGTPRAQALQAITRIVEAKGKALGVGELAPIEDEDDEKMRPGVVGLVLSTKNLSPEMKADLREQGYAIDDDTPTPTAPDSGVQLRRPGKNRAGAKA